jgi:hypothetical protein
MPSKVRFFQSWFPNAAQPHFREENTQMSGRKIAIFRISEIQTCNPVEEGQKPLGSLKRDDKPIYFFSTGRLERALLQGYRVYVVTTGVELTPADAQWVEIIGGPTHVFLTQPKPAGLEDEHHRSVRFLEPWRRLFAGLEIPFPDDVKFPVELFRRLEEFGLKGAEAFQGLKG